MCIRDSTDTTHRHFINDKLTVLRRLYNTLLVHLKHFHTSILDAHDSRQQQLADYQTYFTTPHTSQYSETQRTDTHHTLHLNLHKTTALAASINTPHHLTPIHTKYEAWIKKLTYHPIPTNETSLTTQRRYQLLHRSAKRAIRTHKQLHKSMCAALGRQRNKIIDHKININLLSDACNMVHPKNRTPPQLCATTTTPQAPGLPPLTTYATTIPAQLTATHDTYSRQLGPPPGTSALFYATRSVDDAGTNGVTIHPDRTFTTAHLAHYHPLAHLFDHTTNQRVIQAHHKLKHIFAPTEPHNALTWPWRLTSPTTTTTPIPDLCPGIKKVPGAARNDGFTLNILARFDPAWTDTAQHIIFHILLSLIHISEPTRLV